MTTAIIFGGAGVTLSTCMIIMTPNLATLVCGRRGARDVLSSKTFGGWTPPLYQHVEHKRAHHTNTDNSQCRPIGRGAIFGVNRVLPGRERNADETRRDHEG